MNSVLTGEGDESMRKSQFTSKIYLRRKKYGNKEGCKTLPSE
jgi:hypothetical protein